MHQNYIELSAVKYAAAPELAQRVVGGYNSLGSLGILMLFLSCYLPQP